jgi:hypothetical protein
MWVGLSKVPKIFFKEKTGSSINGAGKTVHVEDKLEPHLSPCTKTNAN